MLDHALEKLLGLAAHKVRAVGVQNVDHLVGLGLLAFLADHVTRGAARLVVEAKDMLDAGDRALVGLLRELDHRAPGLICVGTDGRELVDAAERGLGVAGGELGAHAKRVDGRALGKKRLDGVLVQVVGNRDLDVGQARLVKGRAGLFGQASQVTRVDAHRRQALSALLHLFANYDGVLDALVDIVGIQKKAAVFGT